MITTIVSITCDWCDKTKQGHDYEQTIFQLIDQGWTLVKEGEFCSDDCREKARLPDLLTNGRFSYRGPPRER